MTRSSLPSLLNSAVAVTIDGRPALAVLRLPPDGSAVIETLCYVRGPEECPMILHVLTNDEISGIAMDTGGTSILTSSVDIRASAWANARGRFTDLP